MRHRVYLGDRVTALWASFKLYIIAAMVAVLIGVTIWFGAHERHIGETKVQAKWDVAKAAQVSLAEVAVEKSLATNQKQATSFAGIESNYIEVTTHAPTPFDLPAALAAGNLQLRDRCPVARSSGVPEATARARAADAAAAASATQRLTDSVAAVRAADASDARERVLSAQVIALQDVLRAEREK